MTKPIATDTTTLFNSDNICQMALNYNIGSQTASYYGLEAILKKVKTHKGKITSSLLSKKKIDASFKNAIKKAKCSTLSNIVRSLKNKNILSEKTQHNYVLDPTFVAYLETFLSDKKQSIENAEKRKREFSEKSDEEKTTSKCFKTQAPPNGKEKTSSTSKILSKLDSNIEFVLSKCKEAANEHEKINTSDSHGKLEIILRHADYQLWYFSSSSNEYLKNLSLLETISQNHHITIKPKNS